MTKERLKKAAIFSLIWIPFAAIGGYFTGKYAYASYSEDIQQMLLQQLGSIQELAIVSTVGIMNIAAAFVSAITTKTR